MTMSRASVIGLGCAAPALRRTQDEALAMSLAISPPATDQLRRQVEAMFLKCGVGSRGVAAPGAGEGAAVDPLAMFRRATVDDPRGATTGERMIEYAQRAVPLAVESSRAAIDDARIDRGAVTHLVTASCTGFSAPGWDLELVRRLGMSESIARTHLGFMGCHAAVNALRVADAFASADSASRVLVCCSEVCSIHFQYAARPDQVVANALFADGAAAAVVSCQGDRALARIASFSSRVLPESADQMGWDIGDHGFQMRLSAELPNTIARHAGAWLGEWLDGVGVGIAGVQSWAAHPGGPRILSAIGEAAPLSREMLRASRETLAEHGNMSSPTVLFILDRIRRSVGGLQLPCVVISFGPGVAAEAMLLV